MALAIEYAWNVVELRNIKKIVKEAHGHGSHDSLSGENAYKKLRNGIETYTPTWRTRLYIGLNPLRSKQNGCEKNEM